MPRTGPNPHNDENPAQRIMPDLSAAPAPPIPPVEYASKAEFVRNAFVWPASVQWLDAEGFRTLSADRLARISIDAPGAADTYTGLTVRIIHVQTGEIDRKFFRFDDYLSDRIDGRSDYPSSSRVSYAGFYLYPHANRGWMWHIANPRSTAAVVDAVEKYIGLFRQKLRPDLEEQIDRLKRPDAEVEERENAAIDIGKIGDAAGVPALVAALGDADKNVRWRAAEALGEIKNAAAVPALVAAMGDADADVRWRAAEALGKIGDAAAVPALIAALGDAYAYVRYRAAEALGRIGDAAAVPALIAALGDAAPDVRWRAAEALGEIKNAAAVPALVAALGDADADVRRNAASALRAIGTPEALAAVESNKEE